MPDVLAAVDLGSNSFHLVVARHRNGQLLVIDRLREPVQLASGLDEDGRLDREVAQAALACLRRFGQRIAALRADAVRVAGTSALRRIRSSETFLSRASEALGHPLQVISGREEARLIYAGVAQSLPKSGQRLVVDIGGGSTEIVTESAARSADVGSVRLTDLYLESRPAPAAAVDEARRHARRMLDTDPAPGAAVGVAGTWTTLAAVTLERYDPEEVHHSTLDRATVSDWVERLSALTVEDTAALPGIEPRRAPVILGGSIVAEQVMEVLGVDRCVVSERDLLDGIAAGLRDVAGE